MTTYHEEESPTEVRAHPRDGRIAQLLRLYSVAADQVTDKWLCTTAVDGHVQMEILQPEDVADWRPLTGGDP